MRFEEEMGRKKSSSGPTGAIVGGGGTTPLYGQSPVHNTPGYGSPRAGYGSPDPRERSPQPYVGPPAYAPGSGYAPSAPPEPGYPAVVPGYAVSPQQGYAMSPQQGYVDQEAGPPPQKPRIKQNRKCRDIVFLALFLAYGIGIIIESSFGFNKGDPRR